MKPSLEAIDLLLTTQEKLLEQRSFACSSQFFRPLKEMISQVYDNAVRSGDVSIFLTKDLPKIKKRVGLMSECIEQESDFLKGYLSRVLNSPFKPL